MSKRVLWALLLIAVSVIILILNAGGNMALTLLPKIAVVDMNRAIVFLAFMVMGAVIGILLK